ncbi:MAG: hypothetical protein ACRC2R_09450 [Xenococcaceae cyanobacterium]
MKLKAIALSIFAIATATPAQAGEFDDYLRQQRYDNATLDRANARTDNIRIFLSKVAGVRLRGLVRHWVEK